MTARILLTSEVSLPLLLNYGEDMHDEELVRGTTSDILIDFKLFHFHHAICRIRFGVGREGRDTLQNSVLSSMMDLNVGGRFLGQ